MFTTKTHLQPSQSRTVLSYKNTQIANTNSQALTLKGSRKRQQCK